MIGIAIVWMVFHFMTSTNTITSGQDDQFGLGAKLRLTKRGGISNEVNKAPEETERKEPPRQLTCPKWTPQKPYIVVGYDKSSPKGCNGPACFLNEGHSPVNVKLNPEHPCRPVQKCVTVTIKTTPHLLHTYVQTLFHYR